MIDTFKQQKRLTKGDPISSMLLNIFANMLAILIEHAKVDRGLSILHMPMT
jgi:hypothetical protein